LRELAAERSEGTNKRSLLAVRLTELLGRFFIDVLAAI